MVAEKMNVCIGFTALPSSENEEKKTFSDKKQTDKKEAVTIKVEGTNSLTRRKT
jgi:hypothetical protein